MQPQPASRGSHNGHPQPRPRMVAVGGMPASGKTTLMLRVLARLCQRERPSLYAYGLVRGHLFAAQRVLVLGVYDGTDYAGTDKLAMDVLRDAPVFLHDLALPQWQGWTILLEGDRLVCHRFLAMARKVCDLTVYLLEAAASVQAQRHRTRGDRQNPTWLAGRATKYAGIAAQYPHVVLPHNTPADLARAADVLLLALAHSVPTATRVAPAT